MRDTSKVRRRNQETTAQLTFAAMMNARATLHEAIIRSGMTIRNGDRVRVEGDARK
ncbi:MAG: hypothetical protein ACRELY_00555 [Polyangiaceae bacterium]